MLIKITRLALLSILLSAASCERSTEVELVGGFPLTFVMSGSGSLGDLIVYGPEQEKIPDPFDDTYALWEIAPEEVGTGAPVEELGTITYGVVPKGYKQVRPEGAPAPPLVEGTRYKYWLVTVNAPHAMGYFEIRNGKAVKVRGPHYKTSKNEGL